MKRLRAYVGYTGRFVVGRGRGWSDGCGLHTYEVFRDFNISKIRARLDPLVVRITRVSRTVETSLTCASDYALEQN